MKKTLTEDYSFLKWIKVIITIGTSLYFMIMIVSIGELSKYSTKNDLFLISSITSMILVLFGSIGYIMIINFLFKLDELKNNLEGKKIKYYENGQKRYETNYKDGKIDGQTIMWYENGQKYYEHNYKDGKVDGLKVEWYEDGQKKREISVKDGKYNGPFTEWYKNGKKESEIIYKDFKKVSGKYWNEDGSVNND